MNIKTYLIETFFPPDGRKSTYLEKFIIVIIILSILSTVFETEKSLYSGNEKLFQSLEYIFVTFFIIEYILRLIFSGSKDQFSGIAGRIKYIFTPLALIDLLAILPTLILEFSTDLFLLRIFRLLRILRMAKLARSNKSIRLFLIALRESRTQLFGSLIVTFFILFIGAILLYLTEGSTQPDVLGSIPRALWFSMATLTTVGYGDVYPITVLGKIVSSLIAILGIGIIAMPAGIIAANFNTAIKKDRDNK